MFGVKAIPPRSLNHRLPAAEDAPTAVIFMSGDDEEAKADVTALFREAGFFGLDLGGLREGGRAQQFRGPLALQNLIRLP